MWERAEGPVVKYLPLDDKLYGYLLDHSLRDTPLLKRVRDETAAMPNAGMQVAAEQGQFLAFLIHLLGCRKALEVGVFTGYSSLCVALALPADGRLVACEYSAEYAEIAQGYWKEAGVRDKIELRLGAGADSLRALLAEGQQGTFDYAFVDADKVSYDTYYELALQLLRPGGLLLLDNVLWSGQVARDEVQDQDTVALRALNAKLHHDPRIDLSMLTVADGLTLARKRS